MIFQDDAYAAGLSATGAFTLCEVGHNAPAHMHAGPKLAWYARVDTAHRRVECAPVELPAAECDFKLQGDHSAMSNLARVVNAGRDPAIVREAQRGGMAVGRFRVHGAAPAPGTALGALLRQLHDEMAPRTLPRWAYMSPPWVAVAREIILQRCRQAEYAGKLAGEAFVFAEEFRGTPLYVSPDGVPAGFRVACTGTAVPTVGYGPAPAAHGLPDVKTAGEYAAVVPVGRTVVANYSDEDRAEASEYSRTALAKALAREGQRSVVSTFSPSKSGRKMPAALTGVLAALHDDISRRTSGELPSDYHPAAATTPAEWSTPQRFDRHPGYDPSWLRYDKVDIYGNPLPAAAQAKL